MSEQESLKTARSHGYLSCHSCGLLSKGHEDIGYGACCPRCQAPLHDRKPKSVQKSFAFLLSAMVLYLPANLLPIMETSTLVGTQQNTIMSGVAYLWIEGSWPLAVIVFIASVLVPLLKMLSMLLILLSVQQQSSWAPLQRASLFRVLEKIGPWSMLDIYVVAVLVALVRFQSLATIHAGPGALAFGAVVVLTMLSTMSFDPRLIWDALEKKHDESPS